MRRYLAVTQGPILFYFAFVINSLMKNKDTPFRNTPLSTYTALIVLTKRRCGDRNTYFRFSKSEKGCGEGADFAFEAET